MDGTHRQVAHFADPDVIRLMLRLTLRSMFFGWVAFDVDLGVIWLMLHVVVDILWLRMRMRCRTRCPAVPRPLGEIACRLLVVKGVYEFTCHLENL